MKERARELTENARELRGSNELREAGNHYTAAAYEYQGTVIEHSFPEPDRTYNAVSSLTFAATCYRICGDKFHVQNRCDVGISLVENYVQHIKTVDFDSKSFADLRRGAWPEFIGDL